MDLNRYHPRRMDREMSDRESILAVIRGQKFLTLAMCQDDQPYLVTMNYAFDEAEDCFYLHAAAEGRKLDILRANPRVWGQVLEDRGYQAGKCTHHYRCVMFEGQAELVEDLPAKRRAIELMVGFYEGDSGKLKAVTDAALGKTVFLRVRVATFSGKQGPAPKPS